MVKLPLVAFVILAPILSAGGVVPMGTTDPREESVVYASDVRLAAALLLPEGSGSWPAAVIAQGSGPSDRTNVWARGVADVLRQHGVAVLLSDKRGSGQSEGDWRSADFADLARDTLAGVRYLRGRDDIDPKRVGVVGLSQGGWVVPIAAALDPDIAFVINLSGATVSFAEQSFVEMANTAKQAGLSAAGVEAVLRLNEVAGRYLVGGSWESYSQARENALDGPAGKVAAGFPASRTDPVWTFLRQVAAYDPLPYWIVVAQPVFIAYGERDEEDNVPVRESVSRMEFLRKATHKRNYTVVVVPSVGHSLWVKQGIFAPVLLDSLARWLDETVEPKRPAD